MKPRVIRRITRPDFELTEYKLYSVLLGCGKLEGVCRFCYWGLGLRAGAGARPSDVALQRREQNV